MYAIRSYYAIEIGAKNIATEVVTLREKARSIAKVLERSPATGWGPTTVSFLELDRSLSKIVPKLTSYNFV